MKKTTLLFLFTIYLTGLQPATAQNILYTMIVGDTTILNVTGANGSIQWQQSPDSLNWSNISGATSNPQTIITDTSYTGKRYLRASITDTSCPNSTPYYSSVIRHKILVNTSQLQIGDWFHGGIVFYIDTTGHGLIAPTQNQQTYYQWGCATTQIGSSAQSTSDGAANTVAIVTYHDGLPNYYGNPTQCHGGNNGQVAAKLCYTLTLNGFTDWFLPAKDQLNLLYQQKNIVGGFPSSCYLWSSTEYVLSGAWAQNISNGNQFADIKTYNYSARCIRSF